MKSVGCEKELQFCAPPKRVACCVLVSMNLRWQGLNKQPENQVCQVEDSLHAKWTLGLCIIHHPPHPHSSSSLLGIDHLVTFTALQSIEEQDAAL